MSVTLGQTSKKLKSAMGMCRGFGVERESMESVENNERTRGQDERFNICLDGVVGDNRENGEKTLFQKIMPRTFQNLREILIFTS